MHQEREWIREQLKFLKQGYKKIALLPMGKWGKICGEILQDELCNQEILCLDNNNYDNKTVFPIDREENWDEETLYLITVENEEISSEIENQCKKYVDISQIKKLFSPESIPQICKVYGKVHLDFLCVGFQKCGTSSLQDVLMKHPDIFLPSNKENYFANNIYSSIAHENFQRVYKDSYKKKIVGGIEPTYISCADTVFQYFGLELKIFMCVRNPREALYSKFKMNMRDSIETVYYMNKYGKISPEVFEEWIDRENDKEDYKYIDCINDYLKYYDKENIKIVVFEELISNTRSTMNDLQRYLGVDADCMVNYENLPHLNGGATVPKDLASVYVNQNVFALVNNQTDIELQTAINNLRGEISELTNIEYYEEMNRATVEKLNIYYADSIRKLETFMGKSLKGIWY